MCAIVPVCRGARRAHAGAAVPRGGPAGARHGGPTRGRVLPRHRPRQGYGPVSDQCALSSLYAVVRDGHTPARQFLVAALQAPVMAVLLEDEFFLDINPDKAMDRAEYAAKVGRYRKWTVQSLYNLTSKLIASLRDHWANFPSTIAWIVQQMVHLLKQHSSLDRTADGTPAEATLQVLHKLIASLSDHWANFPSTIAWIVQQMVHLLKQHSSTSQIDCVTARPLVQLPLYYSLDRTADGTPAEATLQVLHKLIASLRDHWYNFPSTIAWIVQQMVHLLKQHSNTSQTDCVTARPLVQLPLYYSLDRTADGTPAEATLQVLHKLIASLRDHWYNFPSTIAWIVQQMVHLLKQHSRTSEREIHAICTDLVLNCFICPAIVNPEAHGVVEVPVSYIARFNLIQIAQIMEPKVRDLYTKFERSCVWSLVERVTMETHAPAPPPPPNDAPLRTDAQLHTTVALYTAQEVQLLINFLRRISSKLNNNTPSLASDEQASSSAPVPDNALSEDSSSGEACAARLAALLQTMEPNYRSRLHDLLKKMPDLSKYSILAKVPKPRLPRSASSNSSLALSAEDKPLNGGVDKDDSCLEHIEVLIIKLANAEEHDYVVLECYYGGSEAGDADETGSALAVAGAAPVQKRTRFSVSHDEVSLGNTSDNLEAVSEAASNHSVTSSLELETEDQNDNLSDMVRLPQNVPAVQAGSAQAKLLKQTRNEIEDKFCKFEIKIRGAQTFWRRIRRLSENITIKLSRTIKVDTDDCVSVAARSDTSWPRRPSQQEEFQPIRHPTQNGNMRRPDVGSPRHTSRPNLPNRSGSGYLSATAALHRGGELDLSAHAAPSTALRYPMENRKSILVNGYPVMTCYATSAPESPSTSAPTPLPNDVREVTTESVQTESTLDANSDATSQWVDDSFPPPHHSNRAYPSTSKYDLPSTSKNYETASKNYDDNDMDRSLNSSESSFNALSVSQTLSISSSRVDLKRDGTSVISLSTLSVNSADTSVSDKSSSQRDGASVMSLSTLSVNSADTSVSDKSSSQDGLVGNLDELKNNVRRQGGNLLNRIKMFRQKGRHHQHQNGNITQ
ncbi:putative GTPase activating protein and VPS9 domains 1 isoform 1 [Operophtera brumata]|uniref:Putative GTPase activating protein and VPS9 domains 1 isoform 1 n=1 Tax=Operophtera brumata TaxID=104452 RepID=A0A0L7KXS5_OPEBR|nr:putative GTPase activating protein and VPS9 domains 1 isoform 1 [Operophtera brumata]